MTKEKLITFLGECASVFVVVASIILALFISIPVLNAFFIYWFALWDFNFWS